jgi:hypothetical protein
MDWAVIERFFNNQSVGAFFGAFAAFLLVVLNDWRRDRKKVRNLRAEVEMNLGHAKGKLEAVRRNRSLMREHNRVMPAPIIKFNTVLIRQLTAQILDLLTLDQRRAVEALCYTMEATDGLLEEAYGRAKQLSGVLTPADRIYIADQLLIDYADALVNLKRLIEMCDKYLGGYYGNILTKQFDRREYEEL